jgi:iron complex transport system ATP-binding protein
VAVLHELNLAFRYADHLIVMAAGEVVASGPPREIVTAPLMRDVYGLDCRIVPDPVAGTPLVVPELRPLGGGPSASADRVGVTA